MNFSELGRIIETLGKDRGIDKRVVIRAIEQAFLVTARKKFGAVLRRAALACVASGRTYCGTLLFTPVS